MAAVAPNGRPSASGSLGSLGSAHHFFLSGLGCFQISAYSGSVMPRCLCRYGIWRYSATKMAVAAASAPKIPVASSLRSRSLLDNRRSLLCRGTWTGRKIGRIFYYRQNFRWTKTFGSSKRGRASERRQKQQHRRTAGSSYYYKLCQLRFGGIGLPKPSPELTDLLTKQY
jgi:hypothetical protein